MELINLKKFNGIGILSLWLVVILSLLTLGSGLFIGSFFGKIILDFLQKYKIYDSSKSVTELSLRRIIFTFLIIFLITSIIVTLSYWIIGNFFQPNDKVKPKRRV